MKWFRLHVGFSQHPKIAGLSDKAFRAHVAAMEWTTQYETDGDLEPGVTSALPSAVRAELVKRGVWESHGSAYRIHDWTQWNTPVSHLQKQREAGRSRIQRYREESSG
jgi:hypothetical protein